jgi:Lrp/AsnC family leucine-responsive transcriptional regulator
MPLQLDNYDVSILKSLLKDGRKSFRGISREAGITTPTVKARFTRLVNIGFIKSVSPIIDLNIVEENILSPELEQHHNKGNENSKVIENEDHKSMNKRYPSQQQDIRSKIKKGLKIKLDCEFCKGPISANPHVFKFANFERFFCCNGCWVQAKICWKINKKEI